METSAITQVRVTQAIFYVLVNLAAGTQSQEQMNLKRDFRSPDLLLTRRGAVWLDRGGASGPVLGVTTSPIFSSHFDEFIPNPVLTLAFS
jgi:hypothetical protein